MRGFSADGVASLRAVGSNHPCVVSHLLVRFVFLDALLDLVVVLRVVARLTVLLVEVLFLAANELPPELSSSRRSS